MDHAGGSSSGGGGVSESNSPQSLDKPLTQELYGFGLLVPPGCRLAKPWRICKDGYPTLDNPATPEQLRVHPGGCYNTRGRHDFWDEKNYNDVIRRYRQAAPKISSPGGDPSPPAARWWPGCPGRVRRAECIRPRGRRLAGLLKAAGVSATTAHQGKGRGRERGGDPGDGGSGGKPATCRR
ncbi:hypothetical protein ZWY2020_036328 [Hordeum vulgare]|nr:hypothetical protein ZWY2020_036328 [Hordeum vulgare]